MEQQWPVTRVGWLATRWPLTQPNPRWPTATLQLATRPVTSSSTPMCMFKMNKYLNQKNSWSIDHVVFCQVKLWWCYTSFAFFFLSLRNDGSEFGGSIYQKVNDKLETAVNLAWTAGSNGTRFGIAAKYQLDSSASISVSCNEVMLPLPFASRYLKNVSTAQWNCVGNEVMGRQISDQGFDRTFFIMEYCLLTEISSTYSMSNNNKLVCVSLQAVSYLLFYLNVMI